MAAGEAELPVFNYQPTRAKNVVTGSGRAGKEQIRQAVAAHLKTLDAAKNELLSTRVVCDIMSFYTEDMTLFTNYFRILLRQKRRDFLSNSPCFFIILWTLISFLIDCFREKVKGNFKSSCRDLFISGVGREKPENHKMVRMCLVKLFPQCDR